ncbi:hypothetical protein F2Q69_00059447 [Brassica cretica]|uniref:Uncharacterized protein n=1 Tax=Brassica cretica TaxID=69181 RepID=A0A8S9RF89_BRACR|nr:hypothetical protein F2Q69_00059447 [Brassica cretica]
MSDTNNHGEEISANPYTTLARHQFRLESLGDKLQKIENTTTTRKDKWRRGDEAMWEPKFTLSLRSDRALARARSLRSDRAVCVLGRYVATEFWLELRLELGLYVATEPCAFSVAT